MATGYTGDVQECEKVWQEWHRALCAKCVEMEKERQLMNFTLKVRAMWMKFRELGRILCMRGVSLRMKGVVYKACVHSILTYGAETWAMKAGVFQRL